MDTIKMVIDGKEQVFDADDIPANWAVQTSYDNLYMQDAEVFSSKKKALAFAKDCHQLLEDSDDGTSDLCMLTFPPHGKMFGEFDCVDVWERLPWQDGELIWQNGQEVT